VDASEDRVAMLVAYLAYSIVMKMEIIRFFPNVAKLLEE
jgi:hypothetical protein